MNKTNKIEKGDTMIYEEKRFMAVSEIEKECCTGCCFYDNGNCQLENPNCFNSGIIWVQKEDYMSEISEKAIKLAIEAMRPIPVYSSPCYSVIDNRSPEEKHEEEMRFCKDLNDLRCEMLTLQLPEYQTHQNGGVCHSVSYLNNHILSIQSPDFQ